MKIKRILFIGFTCLLTLTGCKKQDEYFNVKFYHNDTLLKEEKVKKGDDATSPNIDDIISDLTGYEFCGWDQLYENVQTDLIVNTVFIKKNCHVQFYVDDNVISDEYVEYGANANKPANPTKIGYNFIGWDSDFTNITEDMQIHAMFEKKIYKVTFLDAIGNILKTEDVAYLDSATAPLNTELEYYKFLNWDTDFSCIKNNLTVTGIYEKIMGTIHYYFNDEELDLSPKTYTIGDTLTLPEFNLDGYYFNGWYLSELSLTKYTEISADDSTDFYFVARVVETNKHELLVLPNASANFTDVVKKLHSSGNSYVYQPVFPNGVNSSATQYDWSTSDSSIAIVSAYSSITPKNAGYCILTATLKSDPTYTINCVIKSSIDGIAYSNVNEANNIELCTVTFVGLNDEVLEVQQVAKSSHAIAPTPKSYEGLSFTGWDHDLFNITTDLTIKATYKTGNTSYEGKKIAIIGDSISTYQGYIPANFSSFYPYPTGDVFDVNQTWWMRVINSIGGSLFINNSYSGSCVATNEERSTKNMSRLKYLLINGLAPDIIIIYMGSNDCASSGVSSNTFNNGYREMIENIKTLCPNAEIILSTLPTTSFYTATDQKEFNDIITNYATIYNLKLLDISNVDISNHLIDSAHPKSSGMKLIADKMIEELLK